MGNKWQIRMLVSLAAVAAFQSASSAHEGWSDFTERPQLPPAAQAVLGPTAGFVEPIGKQVLNSKGQPLNTGTRGDDYSRYYGGNYLPPTSTAAVDITVTGGAGGFDLHSDSDDYRAFIEFSRRASVFVGQPEYQRPSNGQTWDEYVAGMEF